ncbi:MAG TPA: hypothetical protein VGN72_04315 [Tepidisphaeraceae bacterium]|jgi:hypothetical protein|nr:hypothetical protein [Tepidisphaeraceae bacterium]
MPNPLNMLAQTFEVRVNPDNDLIVSVQSAPRGDRVTCASTWDVSAQLAQQLQDALNALNQARLDDDATAAVDGTMAKWWAASG